MQSNMYSVHRCLHDDNTVLTINREVVDVESIEHILLWEGEREHHLILVERSTMLVVNYTSSNEWGVNVFHLSKLHWRQVYECRVFHYCFALLLLLLLLELCRVSTFDDRWDHSWRDDSLFDEWLCLLNGTIKLGENGCLSGSLIESTVTSRTHASIDIACAMWQWHFRYLFNLYQVTHWKRHSRQQWRRRRCT